MSWSFTKVNKEFCWLNMETKELNNLSEDVQVTPRQTEWFMHDAFLAYFTWKVTQLSVFIIQING
jgi:hypothetical protein